MSRHFTPMDKAVHSNTVGDMQAIHAENRLLSPAFFCSERRLEPPKEIDAGGALKAITREGDHIYTEDNVVIFHEWTKDEADNIVATSTHPGTLRAGDLVNMGVSFRIVHYSGKGRIQVRLDSVAVIDRRCGDIKPVAVGEDQERVRDGRVPKKRRLELPAVPAANEPNVAGEEMQDA
ncbi:hypothetical protein ARMGADRAFT_1034252 [Armillaria gallica]|uniref:Uncharacterized protein n=1 Tax=Armillaria gallica TaxID=47427 RepID=A0A2H3DI75_ARMGA|nr:hypothetical protein ARMGADRAFT_1034252 [Armillaria gallica]